MKVLIVDDSRFLRMANERARLKAGHAVITASDGEKGQPQDRKPDLMVLDVMLPQTLMGLRCCRLCARTRKQLPS